MINNELADRVRQKQKKMAWGVEEECSQLHASHLRSEAWGSSLSIDHCPEGKHVCQ